MRLDGVKMNIRSATLRGKQIAFEYDDRELWLTLPSPVAVGEEVEVVLEYDVDFWLLQGPGPDMVCTQA
jgi:hypothetical protein